MSMNSRTNKKDVIILQYLKSRKTMQILDKNFINNNKINSRIVINNKMNNIKEALEKKEIENKEMKIKLLLFGYIKKIDLMFKGNRLLKSVKISKLKTKHIQSFENLFNGCSSLESLYGIEHLDLTNVTSIKGAFYGCKKLSKI